MTVPFSAHQAPSDKESILNEKDVLRMGANSCISEQTLFQMGGKIKFDSAAYL